MFPCSLLVDGHNSFHLVYAHFIYINNWMSPAFIPSIPWCFKVKFVLSVCGYSMYV